MNLVKILSKRKKQITNAEYQHLAGAIQRTSARDLMELVRKGLVIKIGRTGRSAHYVLNPKRDANRTSSSLFQVLVRRLGPTHDSHWEVLK